jgi:hypothetical protein
MSKPPQHLLTNLHRLTTISTTVPVPPSSAPYTHSLTNETQTLRLLLSAAAVPHQPSPAHTTQQLIAAEQEVFKDPVYIPNPTSVLPTLLAYRLASARIAATAAGLEGLSGEVARVKARVEEVRSWIREQKEIRERLLRIPGEGEGEEDDDDPKKKAESVERATDQLLQRLAGFVKTVLVDLLDAEDAGPKKKREKGQERLDAKGRRKEMLGALMRLMNESVESGAWVDVAELGEGGKSLVGFLVRASVAVLDPRDARRVRLVDFGAGFD